jgi:hypothetical protein
LELVPSFFQNFPNGFLGGAGAGALLAFAAMCDIRKRFAFRIVLLADRDAIIANRLEGMSVLGAGKDDRLLFPATAAPVPLAPGPRLVALFRALDSRNIAANRACDSNLFFFSSASFMRIICAFLIVFDLFLSFAFRSSLGSRRLIGTLYVIFLFTFFNITSGTDTEGILKILVPFLFFLRVWVGILSTQESQNHQDFLVWHHQYPQNHPLPEVHHLKS